jgi:hypothetical protein
LGGVVNVSDIFFFDWCIGFILCLLSISGFAGYLPVFLCVLVLKSLIINGIHFSGLHVVAGGFVSLSGF